MNGCYATLTELEWFLWASPPSKGKGPPPQGAYPPRGPGGALAPRMAAEEATVRQTIDTFYQSLVASATAIYLIRIRRDNAFMSAAITITTYFTIIIITCDVW